MKKNIVSKIIIAAIVVIMLIPVIIDMVSNTVLKEIEYKNLDKTISETSNYQFALVYVAPSDDEDIKTSKTEVKDVVDTLEEASTETTLKSFYMDYNELSESERSELFGDSKEEYGYLFLANGELLTSVSGELSASSLETYVSTYSAGEMSPNLKNYKVAEDATEYEKLVKKKNTITMAVFGRDTCFYCNQFKVVYNVVAAEKDLDIYYFDSDSYDSEEYEKLFDLGLTIPASCSSTGEEIEFQSGFSTPLTLFTKNGKVIDCIDGYINKASLITKLETVGMISEDAEEEK